MDSKIRRVIEAAIRAPSGDNCQPWWFRLKDDTVLQVGIEPVRAKSFFDYKHSGTLLSLGCVLENMQIQAAWEGMSMKVLESSNYSFDDPRIDIEFSYEETEKPEESLLKAVYNRTVNRRPFYPVKLKSDVLEKFNSETENGIKTHWFQSKEDKKKWGRVIYLADRIRFSHQLIHEEVFAKILLSKEEAEEKRIGLEIDRLGIGPLAKFLIMLLRPWQRMKKLSRFGVDRMLSRQSQYLAQMSSAVVAVTIPDFTPENWVKAGREVQRLWNVAQQNQVCVHPMTVALFLNARYQMDGDQEFYPGHVPLLKEISENLRQLIPNENGTMLFRVGYAPGMKAPAIRLPYEKFIK